MATGTVKWFDGKKGFGFVVNKDGKDVFVHFTNIKVEGYKCLKEGQVVDYEEFESGKGLSGRNVEIVELPAKKAKTESQTVA